MGNQNGERLCTIQTNAMLQNTRHSVLATSNFIPIRRMLSTTQGPCISKAPATEPLPKQLCLYQSDFNFGPVILEDHENYEVHIMEDINFASGWNTPNNFYLFSYVHRNTAPRYSTTDRRYLRMPLLGWAAALYIISDSVTVYLNGHTITLAENAPIYAFSAWQPIQLANQVFSFFQVPFATTEFGVNLVGPNTILRDPDPTKFLNHPTPKRASNISILGPGTLEGTHAAINTSTSNNCFIENITLAGWVQGIVSSVSQNVIIQNCKYTTLNTIPNIHLNMTKSYFALQNLYFAIIGLNNKPSNHKLKDLFTNEHPRDEIINVLTKQINILKPYLFALDAKTLFKDERPTEIWLSNVRNNAFYAFRFSRFNIFADNNQGGPLYDSIINNYHVTNITGNPGENDALNRNNFILNNTVENSIIANNGIANRKISMINYSKNTKANMGGANFFSSFDLTNIFDLSGTNFDGSGARITQKQNALNIEIAGAVLGFFYPNFINSQDPGDNSENLSPNFGGFPHGGAIRNYAAGPPGISFGALSAGYIFREDYSIIDTIRQKFTDRITDISGTSNHLSYLSSFNFPGVDVSLNIATLELVTFALATTTIDNSNITPLLIEGALQLEFNANNKTVFQTLGIDGNRNPAPPQLFFFSAHQNLQQINSRVNNIVAFGIDTSSNESDSEQLSHWRSIVAFDDAIRLAYKENRNKPLTIIDRIRDGRGIRLGDIDFSNSFLDRLKNVDISNTLHDGTQLGATDLSGFGMRVQRSFADISSGSYSDPSGRNLMNTHSDTINDERYYPNSIVCNNYVSVANGNVNGNQNTSISNFNPSSININMIDTWRIEFTDNSNQLVDVSGNNAINPPAFRENGKLDLSDNATDNFMIRASNIHRPTEYRITGITPPEAGSNNFTVNSRNISTPLPETSVYRNTIQADLSYQNIVTAWKTILD